MNEYSFWRELAIVADCVLNVLTGGYAWESLSARAFRAHRKGLWFGLFFMPKIDRLFSWQAQDAEVNKAAGRVIRQHCERAFWKVVLRRDMHPEYRSTNKSE